MSQPRRGIESPALVNLWMYLAVAAVLLSVILFQTEGHFSYCLDDPYIHLALAERIRHGLYGVNAGEPASSSSSILWPLFFVPFAGTRLTAWMPLVMNLACGALTAWAIGRGVDRSFPADADNGNRRSAFVLLLAASLVFAMNLWGLTYTGLEHSLQVLLCVLCAAGVVRAMRGGRVPMWAMAAAVVLPSVRYEGLLVACGVVVALVGIGAWRAALAVLAASMAVPAGFSLFLHDQGLPWFPLSVLVKSSYKFQDRSALPVRVIHLMTQTLKQSVHDMERLPQLAITALLVAMAWKHRRTRSLRYAIAGAALVGAVQLVLGPVGWFYRYEIYSLAFTLPVLIAAAAWPGTEGATDIDPATRPPGALWGALAGTVLIALVYVKPLIRVPQASLGIYEQQYQLGRLMGEFYRAPVAVNDLGWAAFRRTPEQYTLDLYGLGSYETFRTPQIDRTTGWMDALTQRHHVGLVAIYPEWFPQGVPASWIAVAKLCAPDLNVSLGPVSRRVMLYRTPAGDAATVEHALESMRASLSRRVALQARPNSIADTCRQP